MFLTTCAVHAQLLRAAATDCPWRSSRGVAMHWIEVAMTSSLFFACMCWMVSGNGSSAGDEQAFSLPCSPFIGQDKAVGGLIRTYLALMKDALGQQYELAAKSP